MSKSHLKLSKFENYEVRDVKRNWEFYLTSEDAVNAILDKKYSPQQLSQYFAEDSIIVAQDGVKMIACQIIDGVVCNSADLIEALSKHEISILLSSELNHQINKNSVNEEVLQKIVERLSVGPGITLSCQVGVNAAQKGEFLYSDGFGPCHAVLAELKNGQFVLYHALSPWCTPVFKEAIGTDAISTIYVFQKNKQKNPVLSKKSIAKSTLLAEDLKKTFDASVIIIEAEDYTAITCCARSRNVLLSQTLKIVMAPSIDEDTPPSPVDSILAAKGSISPSQSPSSSNSPILSSPSESKDEVTCSPAAEASPRPSDPLLIPGSVPVSVVSAVSPKSNENKPSSPVPVAEAKQSKSRPAHSSPKRPPPLRPVTPASAASAASSALSPKSLGASSPQSAAALFSRTQKSPIEPPSRRPPPRPSGASADAVVVRSNNGVY